VVKKLISFNDLSLVDLWLLSLQTDFNPANTSRPLFACLRVLYHDLLASYRYVLYHYVLSKSAFYNLHSIYGFVYVPTSGFYYYPVSGLKNSVYVMVF
jgi:hypothetical protein